MAWLSTITVVGVVILVVLVVLFMKARSKDLVEAIMTKRRESSRLVTRGQYMEGLERIDVALSLTEDTFYYENSDLEARLELSRIDEVEYDDELATSRPVTHGCSVLRVRSHSTTLEFILAAEDCKKWEALLPPHRLSENSARAV